MQCAISAAGFNLTISAVLAVMLLAVAGGGWHFGRWLVWLATHRIGQP